jgi:hypothetical protein
MAVRRRIPRLRVCPVHVQSFPRYCGTLTPLGNLKYRCFRQRSPIASIVSVKNTQGLGFVFSVQLIRRQHTFFSVDIQNNDAATPPDYRAARSLYAPAIRSVSKVGSGVVKGLEILAGGLRSTNFRLSVLTRNHWRLVRARFRSSSSPPR